MKTDVKKIWSQTEDEVNDIYKRKRGYFWRELSLEQPIPDTKWTLELWSKDPDACNAQRSGSFKELPELSVKELHNFRV